MKQRSNIITKVARADWRYEIKTLRKTYITLVRSIMDYSLAAWSSWIPSTNMKKLEAAQSYVARAIADFIKTIGNEEILTEGNSQPITNDMRSRQSTNA